MERFRLLLVVVALLSCSMSSAADQVRFAVVSRTVFYVPFWIADRRGYFADEGIETQFTVYDDAEKIRADLKSGKVHIAVSSPESVIMDVEAGGSLRIVAGNAGKLPHFIIAKPAIKSVKDFRGATIGVLSLREGTTFLVKKIAADAGLSPDDYKIVAVGGAPTRWRMLQEGRIDIGLQPFPLSYEADAAGFSNLGPISVWIPDYQFGTINVDQRWARPHAALVARFLRAVKRGQDDMLKNPAFAAEIAAAELRTPLALARRSLEDTIRLRILSEDLSLSDVGMAYVYRSLLDSGVSAPGTFALQKYFDASYLDLSRR